MLIVQGFFRDDENVPKCIMVVTEQLCGYTNSTKSYTLNERIVYYVNYISIKLFKK